MGERAEWVPCVALEEYDALCLIKLLKFHGYLTCTWQVLWSGNWEEGSKRRWYVSLSGRVDFWLYRITMSGPLKPLMGTSRARDPFRHADISGVAFQIWLPRLWSLWPCWHPRFGPLLTKLLCEAAALTEMLNVNWPLNCRKGFFLFPFPGIECFHHLRLFVFVFNVLF